MDGFVMTMEYLLSSKPLDEFCVAFDQKVTQSFEFLGNLHKPNKSNKTMFIKLYYLDIVNFVKLFIKLYYLDPPI